MGPLRLWLVSLYPESLLQASTGLITELGTMNLHSITQGHTNTSWFSKPHRANTRILPPCWRPQYRRGNSSISYCQARIILTPCLSFFLKISNFIQDPNDKLPTVTHPTLFLAFQVKKLRVIFNSSLPLMCISNLLS